MTMEKERLVYTAGTFKIDDTLARCRRVVIRTSVLRLPFSAVYRNERSNPPKYFLGYASLFIGDYAYNIFPLEFEQQIVFLWDNLASQIYARMLCEFINSNSNLVALRNSIPLPGTLVPLPADPGTFPGCPYTFIKFKLEPGARILVTGVGEELETCEGGDFETTVPDLTPPPDPFPPEQARDEDPARSLPEEGEKPGDTAPATVEDPDSSLTDGPCTMTVGIFRNDLGTTEFAVGEVPNSTYATAFLTTVGPGTTYVVQSTGNMGTVTVAGPFNPGSVVVSIVSVDVVC
jgi:hypothetical protein